ncbi:MAG: DNA gyrase subunit A, partial [Synechococcales bacterium]|nr:DNA gyrase subunit A [Synechococcales bacterium]
EFVGNFDNSQQEPTVLPAQLPILLLNGSSGIAVGMATNIPPHNLSEVVDGLIALIDSPHLSDEKLFELIPGPDFPTGGEIIGYEGIQEAYLTGRGSIPLRGVAQVEEIQVGKGKHRRSAIVVTELPYQVNKASLIEKIAELVNNGKILGIADIRDESDREGIRIVIELKRDTSPNSILQALYKQTSLQNNFGVILLALSEGQPKQFSLRQMLQEFITFREETLTRRYRHELGQQESRLHLVEGWITALENLDDVIEILRHAPDGGTAKLQLQEEFDFSDRQADAILGMPLRRLTGLEQQNLRNELKELQQKIAELQKLLNDRKELLKALKKELRSLKKQFADDRKTRILGTPGPLPTPKPAKKDKETHKSLQVDTPEAAIDDVEAAEAQEEMAGKTIAPVANPAQPTSAKPASREKAVPAPVLELFAEEEDDAETVIEVTQKGYIRRIAPKTYQRQLRKGGDAFTETLTELDDYVTQTEFTTTGATLIVLTRNGKAFPIAVREIPQASGKSKGVPLVTLLPSSAGVGADHSAIVFLFFLPEEVDNQFLLLLTTQGKMKRLALTEFKELTNRGLITAKLKEEDEIFLAGFVEEGDQVVVSTSMGRTLRLEMIEEAFPVATRSAQGTQVTRLTKLEQLVGWAIAGYEDEFLLMSQQGFAKRMVVGMLKPCNPGDLGQHVFQFTQKNDAIAGMVVAFPGTEVVITSSEHRVARIGVETVPLASREDKGEKPLKLAKGEKIDRLELPIEAFWEEDLEEAEN